MNRDGFPWPELAAKVDETAALNYSASSAYIRLYHGSTDTTIKEESHYMDGICLSQAPQANTLGGNALTAYRHTAREKHKFNNIVNPKHFPNG